MSRRRLLGAAGAGGLGLLVPGVARARPVTQARALTGDANVVVRWNNAVLQGVRDSKLPEAPPEPSSLTLNATCENDAVPPPERCAVGAAAALWLAPRATVAAITATYASVRFKVSSL